MSAAPDGGSSETAKATVPDSSSSTALKDSQQGPAALEEDDEFEDFPVDGSCQLTTLSVFIELHVSLHIERRLTSLQLG